MAFKAEIHIDKFDDYLKLTSHGSKATEEIKEEDPICPYCGSNQMEVSSYDDYPMTLTQGTIIPVQSVQIHCLGCGMIHPVNKKYLQKYQK